MAVENINSVKSNDVDKLKYQFSKVSLTLENCILPPQRLSPSPSQLDGLDPEVEIELRILGCEMIQTSGILLRLPQVAMATGQVLFQRFFYSKSLVRQTMEAVAMACVHLASKIEEAPRRIRDVINVFHHIRQVRLSKTMSPLILDQNYINLKSQVIKAERRVLKELGFCVHVKHPHKIIVTLLEVLKVKNRKLMQTAWNYMNDSLRTEVFVRYAPETIACACIYLGARVLQFPLPSKPAWFLVFDVIEEDIKDISHKILSLYTRKKPDFERLEKTIEDLRKSYQEAKLKAKGIQAVNNLMGSANSSVPSSPRNGTKSPGSDRKKERSDKHRNSSPNRDTNHRKHRSRSSSSEEEMGSADSNQSGHRRTPPRSFKERRRSRSPKPESSSKRHKRNRSHTKRKRSPSPSQDRKKTSESRSKKEKSSYRDRTRSRSPHDRVNHEKSHKSRNRDRVKESHHSRDKKRR